MPAPSSEWEHLQSTLMRVHNREVREFYSGVADNDISTSRASLKHACLIKDSDTVPMVQLRLWLFEVTVGRLRSVMPEIYGMPVTTFQERNTFFPQVQMYFLESLNDVEPGYSQVEGEISFRLTEPEYENVTPVEAQNLARRIKAVMATPPFVWKKGRVICRYQDLRRGYDFRLYVFNESEGRRIIEQVLDIRNHSPDWDLLIVSESRRNFPINPPMKTIYGKSRKMPRQRPRADVRFRYATLHLHGLQNSIPLVDVSGTRRRALERA